MIEQILATSVYGRSRRQRQGRPFVTLSYAQSLDGSITARAGSSLSLSCPESLVLTHRLRAAHDAILVGIGTILTDDPRLTVRLAPGSHPQPVIIDSHLRFPLDATLLRHGPVAPWIATTQWPDERRQAALVAAGAHVLCIPPDENGRVNLAILLEQLYERGIRSLMIEGGTQVITSFLAEHLADQLVLTIAPVLVGGQRAFASLQHDSLMRQCRLHNVQFVPLGADLIVRGDFEWSTE